MVPIQIRRVSKVLLAHGRELGPFMPWHDSTDPYRWAIAEILLRRTTRTAVARTYLKFVESYPSFESIAEASSGQISGILGCLGLGVQRARQLKQLAETISALPGRSLPCKRRELVKLPGIGEYIAEAMLLYACGRKAFPIDGNILRVLRRSLGMEAPNHAVYSMPYKDSPVKVTLAAILAHYPVQDIRDIHRAVLHVAWDFCRPKPRSSVCPLNNVCRFALKPS